MVIAEPPLNMKITPGKRFVCFAPSCPGFTLPSKLIRFVALPVMAIALLGFVRAQTIEGTIGDSYHVGYIADFNDISVISGSVLLPESAVVFCIEGSAHWPGNGATRQYTLDSTLDFLMPEGADKTLGMVNYVIENYFDSFVDGSVWGPRAGYSLNTVFWELTTVFDGTLASMSGMGAAAEEDPSMSWLIYTTIIDDLRLNFDSIPDDYRSTKYSIQFLVDPDEDYQSLMMISPVPEPSAVMLLGIFGAGSLLHRRRRS